MNIYLSPHLSSVILFLNAADVVDEQHQDGVNRARGMWHTLHEPSSTHHLFVFFI